MDLAISILSTFYACAGNNKTKFGRHTLTICHPTSLMLGKEKKMNMNTFFYLVTNRLQENQKTSAFAIATTAKQIRNNGAVTADGQTSSLSLDYADLAPHTIYAFDQSGELIESIALDGLSGAYATALWSVVNAARPMGRVADYSVNDNTLYYDSYNRAQENAIVAVKVGGSKQSLWDRLRGRFGR